MDAVDLSDFDAGASQFTIGQHETLMLCHTDIDNDIASLAPPDASWFEPKRTRVASGKTSVPNLKTQAFYTTDPSAGEAHDTQGCRADEPRETALQGPGGGPDGSTSNENDTFVQAVLTCCPAQMTTERPLDLDEAIAALPPPDESLFEPRKRHRNPGLKRHGLEENSKPANNHKDRMLEGQKDRALVRRQWSAEEEGKFIDALAKLGPKGSTEPTIDARTGRVTVHLGPGVAEMISIVLGTRSVTQVRSHAQKHFIRLHRRNTKPFSK